jgi:hypothetical protein
MKKALRCCLWFVSPWPLVAFLNMLATLGGRRTVVASRDEGFRCYLPAYEAAQPRGTVYFDIYPVIAAIQEGRPFSWVPSPERELSAEAEAGIELS